MILRFGLFILKPYCLILHFPKNQKVQVILYTNTYLIGGGIGFFLRSSGLVAQLVYYSKSMSCYVLVQQPLRFASSLFFFPGFPGFPLFQVPLILKTAQHERNTKLERSMIYITVHCTVMIFVVAKKNKQLLLQL